MQKFLKTAALATAMALIGTAVFADIGMGAWGRIDFSPIASTNGEDLETRLTPGWGGSGRVGINFFGMSDNMGFNLNMIMDPGAAPNVGDITGVHVKFNDMIRLDYGRLQVDNVRGKLGGNFIIDGPDEDAFFNRFYPEQGAAISITPMDGLFIGASVNNKGTTRPLEETYKGIQVAAGYNIDGIGLIRAQYVGKGADVVNGTIANNVIQAAFNLRAVDGLNAEFSGTIGLDEGFAHRIVVGANYDADGLGIQFRFDSKIGDKFQIPHLGLGVTYALEAPLSLGVDVGAKDLLDENALAIVFGPYVRLGYGNGYFRACFKGTMPTQEGSKFKWDLPLRLEYWF